MKCLRNGSLFSNLLLVAAGAAAGSGVTWLLALRPIASADRMGATALTAPPEGAKSPARSRLSAQNGGDQKLKLAQIIAADDPAHKAEDLNRLGRDVAAEAPAAALEMANEIASEADRVVFVRGAFEAWAAVDPKAAAAFAESSLPAGEMRSEAIRVAISAWAQTDPRAAFQWMEERLTGPLKEEALVALAQGWSQKSPQQAAQWFAETGSTSQPLLSAIAGTWARQNAAAAVAWASQLRDSVNREVGVTSALGELARHDPAAAAEAATPFLQSDPATNPAGAPVRDLATVLSNIWGNTDPAAAAAWVRDLPAGDARTEAAGTLATVWAASDINAAVAWSATLTDPTIKDAVVTHLATTWGAIEPDRALAWLDSLPPETTTRGVQGALNSWAATDAVGLADWIQQMPTGSRNDLARRSLGDVIAAEQPVAALELASGISDPIQQSDSLARYYRAFHRADPAGATEWLQSEINRFPAPAREALSQTQQRLLQSARRRVP